MIQNHLGTLGIRNIIIEINWGDRINLDWTWEKIGLIIWKGELEISLRLQQEIKG